MNEKHNCPLCGEEYHGVPALSRIDNKTLICADCSTRQALDSINVGLAEQEEILAIIHRSQRSENSLEEVTARDVESAFRSLIKGYAPIEKTALKDAEISTFDEANVPTWDRGFFIKCPYGEEFHVVITQTKK